MSESGAILSMVSTFIADSSMSLIEINGCAMNSGPTVIIMSLSSVFRQE